MELLLLCLVVLSGVLGNNALGVNDKCKNGTEPWTCKAASSCKGLKILIEKNEVNLCRKHGGGEVIICCPPESQASQVASPTDKVASLPSSHLEGGRKAEQKCREYAEYVYQETRPYTLSAKPMKTKIDECAITAKTLIVGGSAAKVNEFPHMALIGEKSEGSPQWFCGGSLISPNFILTAAHCNISDKNASVVVRLGELNLVDKNDRVTPIDVKIAQVINHPKYVPPDAYHDISLLKLEKEVELGPNIRPLCLQTKRTLNYDTAIASGWGYTSSPSNFNRNASSILLKVELDMSDDDKCVSKISNWPGISKGIKPDILVCTEGDPAKDTCQGDSGGPLQVVLKEPYCMYSQIGITSKGIGCGSTYPSIYTRVSAYVPWIESIVWP